MLGDESTCMGVNCQCQETNICHVREQIHMYLAKSTSGDRDPLC